MGKRIVGPKGPERGSCEPAIHEEPYEIPDVEPIPASPDPEEQPIPVPLWPVKVPVEAPA